PQRGTETESIGTRDRASLPSRSNRPMNARIAIAVSLLLFAAPPLAAETEANRQLFVTVYNQDIALVREERSVGLAGGRSTLRYADVAAQIDPTSVHLVPVSGGDFRVLEQNFQYDLV